jgi:polyphosphate kinase 2 (PPK2 family)
MKVKSNDVRVREGEKVNLKKWPTRVKPVCRSKEQYQELLEAQVDEDSIWKGRFRSIVDLESRLHRNGTRIIKFFLRLSREEQRKRLLDRIDAPEKNWKFGLADIEERTFWKQYMPAYAAVGLHFGAATEPV